MESDSIISAIEEARKEMQECREYFECAEEPILIDYAIYREAAAKAKYVYLLSEARKLNIKIKNYSTFKIEEKAN
jgi:hypothetical protein